MTDEMTVQVQRPSAIPYVAGGAVAGGLVGLGASAANIGIKDNAYKSWEDAVAKVNKDDTFIKSQIDKAGDNKADLQLIKDQAAAVKAKEEALNKLDLGEGVKADDFKPLAEKEAAKAEAEKALKDAAIESEKKRIVKAEIAYTIEESKLPEGFKKPEGAKAWPEAVEEGGKKVIKLSKEQTKELFESTEPANKDFVKSLMEAHTEELNGLMNGEKKGNLTDEMVNALSDKRQAVTDAQKAIEKAEANLSEKAKAVTADVRKKALDAFKELAEARNTAREKLTGSGSGSVLDKCKKASNWKNAVLGAVILGLAGLMLRPKGEEPMEA